MRGHGRRFLLSILTVAAVTLVLSTGLAQIGEDPRNDSTEYYDAVNGGNCMAHHEGDNLRPMVFRISEGYSEVPIGEVVEIELKISHFKVVTDDTITQDLQDMYITVDKTQAPNIDVISETFQENIEKVEPMNGLTPGDSDDTAVEVLDGASHLFAYAKKVNTQETDALRQDSIDLALKTAKGELTGEGPATYKAVEMDADTIKENGIGPYSLVVTYNSPFEQVGATADVEVGFWVNYTQTQTSFRFEVPGGPIRGADPKDQQTRTVKIPIRVNSEEEGILDFRAEVVNFWAHKPGDGAPRDDGLFYRFTTLRVAGGSEIIRVESVNAPVPVPPTVDLFNLFTRALGFTAVVLVPVAMVTGGVFGKGSRRWLNKLTGGAKKRVLWHNAMSFIIIGIASIHFLLALLEAQFKWTKGLLWGGVGWAVLISLGFTGYYQVRMIKRWNYRVWRHTHLWSAVGVLTFGLLHTLLDGSDLDFVREVIPKWHEWLIWP